MPTRLTDRPTGLLRGLLRAAVSCLAALALLPCVTACTGEADDLYAHHRAFFKYAPVVSVHQLYTALNNPGMFCRITFGTTTISFAAPDGSSTPVQRTATEAYGRPEYVAGFVAGTPSVPDLDMRFTPVAYDLACPACYEQNLVTRSLAFSANETLAGPRCQRTYDLCNGGTATSGEGKWRLYRYQLSYANHLVVIIN